mgnify:CR=1 FL=1
MARLLHSLPGLAAAVLLALLAITGAVLSLDPIVERAGATIPQAGQISVAQIAAKAAATRNEVERIVRTASGAIIVYYFDGDRAAADRIDPVTGVTLAPHEASGFTQFVTRLHRSLLLGDSGRAAAGIGAAFMVVLAISGAFMLAARLGGWMSILRPIRGTASRRWHAEFARFAVLGLLVSGLTGSYMSLATFEFLPDGAALEVATPRQVNGGPRLPVDRLHALRVVDLIDLRELTFPYAKDLTDVYGLTTAQGIGRIDAATGVMLTYVPHTMARRIHETIYMLHTGQGLWQLALLLGLAALCVPVLSATGAVIWWQRRASRPRIRNNSAAQSADTVILVGSEGGGTWQFAQTLHAALSKAGHKVHVGPMNALAPDYKRAERLLILTSTYGDGAPPASANRFMSRLAASHSRLPVAILGFGDRAFPRFCRFAEDVQAGFRAGGWPSLMALNRIDKQSAQDFARWGAELGSKIGISLRLDHAGQRPKSVGYTLIERADYGREVQAPTSIFRFVATRTDPAVRSWWRFRHGSIKPPRFQPGDLVGILPPGNNVPRFYSLASSSRDGILEICVRKQAGGLCSGFLHDLERGQTIDAFIRPNPAFRPGRGKGPLILIGAGAGIGPLVGIIRENSKRRPVHLYWGGRDPASDFLYEGDLDFYIADERLTRCRTAFSRVANGCYVQDEIAAEANVMRDLIKRGAHVMVCGGRDMAGSVATVIDRTIRPLGLDLSKLRSEGRYLEDVY